MKHFNPQISILYDRNLGVKNFLLILSHAVAHSLPAILLFASS